MSKTLVNRLSLAALALPGLMQPAQAERSEETYNTGFQYGHYEESGDRMKVDVFELSAAAPIGKAFTASLDLIRDTMSGASPVFNVRDADGQVRQQISGASIVDQRDVVNVGFSYAMESVTLGLTGGVSGENDYLSRYFGTNLSWDLSKSTTLSASASYAFDDVFPVGRTYRKSKFNQQYLLGVTQVIDKNSLLQSNMTFGYNQGFLSDPYKQVFVENAVGSSILDDVRPDKKFQWAWLTRYARHFKDLNRAALHADYRFYVDDWGVVSHMVETSWDQPIADDWQLTPRFRYYTQYEANFYSAIFDGATIGRYHSSDYRLAGFGTLGGGIKLSKNFIMSGLIKDIKLQAAFDYFDRKASYQLGGNDSGGFDDYSFYMVTASVNVKF